MAKLEARTVIASAALMRRSSGRIGIALPSPRIIAAYRRRRSGLIGGNPLRGKADVYLLGA